MKKHFYYAVCIALFVCSQASAQVNENAVNASRSNTSSGRIIYKPNNPDQDKTDQFEIAGIGGAVFTASNITDGTVNSYKHSLQVTLALIPANKTGNQFQLVFYSPSDNMPQAASFVNGTLSIYYPVELYNDIKEKLEESLAARKKVSVKVIQRTDGYREGSLIF